MSVNTKSILFVCLGNICRSPTGEGIFQAHVRQQEHNQPKQDVQIVVDSAGTIGYHQGNPADARMRQTAEKRGYDLQSRSRKITLADLDDFDLIIAMDRENLQDIRSLSSESSATIMLLSDFLDDQWPTDVPDPYYGGDDGFEYVVDMIEAAVPKIYEHLIAAGRLESVEKYTVTPTQTSIETQRNSHNDGSDRLLGLNRFNRVLRLLRDGTRSKAPVKIGFHMKSDCPIRDTHPSSCRRGWRFASTKLITMH